MHFTIWLIAGHLNLQLFYSFFKSLVGKDVVVELKNDLRYVSMDHTLSGIVFATKSQIYLIFLHISQYLRHTTFGRSIFEHKIDRHQREWYGKISTYAVSNRECRMANCTAHDAVKIQSAGCHHKLFWINAPTIENILDRWKIASFVDRLCDMFNCLVMRWTHNYCRMLPEKRL